jgi:hypothetical protein
MSPTALSFVGRMVYRGEKEPIPNYSTKFTMSEGWRVPIRDYFLNYSQLRTNKRHDRALLCGSGPSARAIGPEAAKYLHSHFDVWASNQFFVHHHLIADFYHAEFKPSTFTFWDRHFLSNKTKVQQYRNYGTQFLYEDRKMFFEYMRKFVNKTGVTTYGFHPRGINLIQPIACTARDGEYAPKVFPLTKKCSASTTLLLDMIKSMGYTSIWLIGIDMKTSEHFWTGQQEYPPALANFRPEKWPMPHTKYTIYEGNGTDKYGNRKVVDRHPTHERGFTEYAPAFLKFNQITAVNFSPQSADLLPLLHVPLNELLSGAHEPSYFEQLSHRTTASCNELNCLAPGGE